jgi:hypothetical protein
MKKKLLLILPMVLFTLVSNAQNHVWDFGNDTTNWPVNSGYNSNDPSTTTIDGLTLISGGSAVGAISASANSFSDGFTSVNMMSVASATGAPAPTKRGLSFPVTGPCTVSLWVFTSSTNRVASISDGTNVLASWTSTPPSPYKTILTATYTGGPGTIYVYTNNTMNFAKLSVSSSLGVNDIKADQSAIFYTNGNQVFVSNVKSRTTVSIYAITGALVKTIETSNDTSFELGSGLWIANVKSEEGNKSVKLVVR